MCGAARQVAQDFGCSVATGGAHDATARMSRGAANIETANRRAVLRIARHRAVEQQLIERQLALENVALGQSDLGFELAWRAYLHMDDAVAEARRIVRYLRDHAFG